MRKKTKKRVAPQHHSLMYGLDTNTFLIIIGGGLLIMFFITYFFTPFLSFTTPTQAQEVSAPVVTEDYGSETEMEEDTMMYDEMMNNPQY